MKGNRPPGRPRNADDSENPADKTGQGAYRRNLQAIGGVLLVLLAFGGFSLWCSQVTSHAAARVGVAQQLADDYQDAATAVAWSSPCNGRTSFSPAPRSRTSTGRRRMIS